MTSKSENQNTNEPQISWRVIRIGELCQLVNGDAYKESDWSKNGVPIIRIQNLNDSSKPFNYWAGPTEGLVKVKRGDVLLAWSGTPGTSFGAHIWNGLDGVLNQHIFRVDLTSASITPSWFVRAVNFSLQKLIDRAHGAVGLAHVTKAEVNALEIPLPPLAEQERIAVRLTEQLATVASARAAAQALPAAYLREIFEGPEASAWETLKIGETCELLPSKSISTTGDAVVRAITTACLSELGFLTGGIKTARMRANDVPECIVRSGEILVARSNTPELVGRAAIFNGEPAGAVATDLTIRVWPCRHVEPSFLAAFLSYLFQTGYWKEKAGGASGTMKKITREQLLALEFRVPTGNELDSLKDQCRIAAALALRLAEVERLTAILRDELAAIDALLAALLREAFNGQA